MSAAGKSEEFLMGRGVGSSKDLDSLTIVLGFPLNRFQKNLLLSSSFHRSYIGEAC